MLYRNSFFQIYILTDIEKEKQNPPSHKMNKEEYILTYIWQQIQESLHDIENFIAPLSYIMGSPTINCETKS